MPAVEGEGYNGIDELGHPRVVMSQEQLLYLCSLNFSWTQIAKLIGVSRVTLFRRRRRDDNELHRFLLGQYERNFPPLEKLLEFPLLIPG